MTESLRKWQLHRKESLQAMEGYLGLVHDSDQGKTVNKTNPESTGHFDAVASDYNKFRTTDMEPVDWLAQAVPQREHSLCDLGCGTARYAFALAERLREAGSPITSPSATSTIRSTQLHGSA